MRQTLRLLTLPILCGLLGAALELQTAPAMEPGTDYSLDGTLEPDEIPGLANSSNYFDGTGNSSVEAYVPDRDTVRVDAPARLPKPLRAAQNVSRTETDSAASEQVHHLQPPKKIRVGSAHFEAGGKYTLVQYRTPSSRRPKQPDKPVAEVKAAPETRTVEPQLPAEHPESLRRSIRTVLLANSKRALTTQHNSPGDLLLMALPYGADAKVWQPNPAANPRDKNEPKGSYIYSIGTLCWNYPCSGKTLLRTDGKRVVARIGAGYQRRPASFLALLAMSNIMPNYEIKVGGGAYSIAHLIASEKAAVSKGTNLSMTLVGLSFYGDPSESWKNEMGETWNIERMVVEELNRSIDQGSSDVTDWLLGLTAAVNLYEEEGKSLRGPMALAKKQIATYQDFVLSIQNEQYLWHPKFFLFKGITPDVYESLFSGGHVLRWLILSMDDEHLQDVRVRRAVANLAALIARVPSNVAAGSMSERQLEALAVSLQSLSIYHQRVFGVGSAGDDPVEIEKSVAGR